ncbi:MAG TPA: hypothetical protein VF221_21370 [Chloroflexota bacterium]
MSESLDQGLLGARLHDLDTQIRELSVRRQYAPNARFSFRLDEQIEAMKGERAAMAELLRRAAGTTAPEHGYETTAVYASPFR